MRILFITSGSIGDVIISTGLLAHLADTYPSARFTIAVGPAAAPLLEAFPQLDRLIVIRKQPWNKHWLKLWSELTPESFDLAIDLRSSAITYLIRARKRVIFRNHNKLQSKAEQLANLLNLPSPPPTRLWAGEAAVRNAEALVPHPSFIVIAPKTNSAAKDWPIERFAELAGRLCVPGSQFVILASAAQQASIQPLVKTLPESQVIDLAGRTDLPTAYALLKRAQLFIGNDSGLLHMAAAAGIPSIGIYGPSNDKTYAPRGPHVTIIKSHEFAPGEEEKRDNAYMQKISVDEVEKVARLLLQ
jgi:lipopolysaccharide export system permease protein